MATDAEKAEAARQKAIKEQAQADRQRELTRREARQRLAQRQDNVIAHGPASR